MTCPPQSSTNPEPAPAPLHLLDVARGLLAVALERCGPGSDAALEICAAWEALDDAGSASWLVEPVVPSVFGADVVAVMARRALRSAIVDPKLPASSALPTAMALRHLQVASRMLAEDTTCDGSPWD